MIAVDSIEHVFLMIREWVYGLLEVGGRCSLLDIPLHHRMLLGAIGGSVA